MTCPKRVARRRGRPARRPAERDGHASASTTSVAFCDALLGRGPARGGGGRVRLAEVGAADGRLGRGPPAREEAAPARARRCWSRTARATSGRARRARARSRCSPPPASPSTARTSTPRSTSPSSASRSSCPRRSRTGSGCAATCPPASAVPTKDASIPRRSWRWRCGSTDAGCDEISIGDTIGVGVPTQVADVMGRLAEAVPREALAVHFHDTRGTALANVLAALQIGHRDRGQLGGRPGRLSLRAGRQREPGHRGPALHAARHGHRDRRRPRPGGRRVARARARAWATRCPASTSRPRARSRSRSAGRRRSGSRPRRSRPRPVPPPGPARWCRG